MEVSTEISQKIRSAIKAKLMELGAYVDDELPDYIMVMVANKKSRAQMSGDLALFLGTNTDAFTGWLHGLLGKLQTITVESGDKGKIKGGKDKKKEKKDGSKEKKKPKKRSSDPSKRKSSIDKSSINNEQNQNSESNPGHLVESATQSIVLKEDSSITKDHSHGNDVGATTTVGTNIVEADHLKNNPEDVEDVRQLLVTGTQADELAEELETTEAEVERSKALTSGRNKTIYAKEKEILPRLVSHCHSSSSAKSKSRSPSPEKLDNGSRKRKIPISVVASVSRKCDDEEEYDPYNPAVGSVASVVKVTARKSSVPASLQANRETEDKDCQESNVGAQVGIEEPPSKMIKLSEIGHIEDIKKALEEVLKKSQETLDDISHFSKMVESCLRKLKPQVVSLAKIRIEQVFIELEGQEYVPRQRAGDAMSKHYTNHSQKKTDHLPAEKIKKTSESIALPTHGSNSPLSTQNLTSAINKNSETASNYSTNKLKHSNLVKQAPGFSNNHLRDDNRFSTSEADSRSKGSNERIIFHPKSKLKSSNLSSMNLSTSVGSPAVNAASKGERASSHPKTISDDSAGKIRERRFSEQKNLPDGIPQSPVSSSKVDSGSPSSVHSCPPSSTSGLEAQAVRQCTVTTSTVSRDSTLSPIDSKHDKCTTSQPDPGLLKPSLEKHVASILVDSIHSKRRPDAESTSVLKQSWNRSPGLKGGSAADCEDDSPRISSEALKVMAKNLKVTVINKRATRVQDASSSEDSSSDEEDDDDEETSDDEEEQGEEEIKTLEKGNENSKSTL